MCIHLRCALFVLTLVAGCLAVTLGATEKSPADYAALSRSCADVGKRYLTAYFHKDWDALEPLLSEEASFADPTAARIFGAAAKKGKTEIMKAFREGYAPISFQFTPERELLAIDHAIFIGELTWTYQLPLRKLVVEKMPMMVVLQIVDGKVVSHLDYADYLPYFKAELASRPAQTKAE